MSQELNFDELFSFEMTASTVPVDAIQIGLSMRSKDYNWTELEEIAGKPAGELYTVGEIRAAYMKIWTELKSDTPAWLRLSGESAKKVDDRAIVPAQATLEFRPDDGSKGAGDQYLTPNEAPATIASNSVVVQIYQAQYTEVTEIDIATRSGSLASLFEKYPDGVIKGGELIHEVKVATQVDPDEDYRELQRLCRDKGLPSGGTRGTLLKRLQEAAPAGNGTHVPTDGMTLKNLAQSYSGDAKITGGRVIVTKRKINEKPKRVRTVRSMTLAGKTILFALNRYKINMNDVVAMKLKDGPNMIDIEPATIVPSGAQVVIITVA